MIVTDFFSENSAFFIFVLLLSLFLFYKRENLAIQGRFPILYMLMYRTSLGLDKMKRWSQKYKRTYLALAFLCIFVGVVGIFLSLGLMIYSLDMVLKADLSSGGGLVLPLKTQSGLDGAVPIFYVPFWYWIVSLFVIVVVHEFAHGVIAERFNIKIKSSGFAFGALFLPILPAAFVEPDEKDLRKKPRWQQIAVMGAGSTSNFLFGFLFLALFLFAAEPLLHSSMEVSEVSFNGVMNESELKAFGINEGSIQSIDGKAVSEFEFVVLDSFSGQRVLLPYLYNLSEQENVTLSIEHNGLLEEVSISPFFSEEANRSLLGITNFAVGLDNKDDKTWLGNFPLYLRTLLNYLVLLSIGIGIMNLLPLWITDGGQIAFLMISKVIRNEETALRTYNLVSFLSLCLILLVVWPGIIKSLL